MSFNFWQRWGAGIDEVSFANAWLALGMARVRSSVLVVTDLEKTCWSGPEIDWKFPAKGCPITGTSDQWANAWIASRERMTCKQARLRILDAPYKDAIHPWYGLFWEARPMLDSISLSIEAPRAELNIGWPLRLGCLSDTANRILEQVAGKWPSAKLARVISIDRFNPGCDLLLHMGTAKTLLQKLLEVVSPVKTNILLLQGGEELEWSETEAVITSILSQTRASGFVFLPRSLKEDHISELINGIVREMSHDQPVDVALAYAIKSTGFARDTIAAFTSGITSFSIRGVAKRCNARVAALPHGTILDLSRVGIPNVWLARGVDGGIDAGGTQKHIMADNLMEASTICMREECLSFESEGEGSSILAEVSMAIAMANPPEEAIKARAARFLQQRSFVWSNNAFCEAKHGFVAGALALIRVRIAAPEIGWDALPTEFPTEKLSPHLEMWTLTVWFTEPNHLTTPMKQKIELPRDGNSTECEFQFRPAAFSRFEGRISVLHRGRVIQTAVLQAEVFMKEAPETGSEPKLVEHVAIRKRLGSLDMRRRYDLAFVVNHDSKGRPLLTALSEKAAWVKDLSKMSEIAKDINQSLSPVASSVIDYADGLRGEKGVALLVQLARHGSYLKLYLDEVLNDPSNNPVCTGAEFVQIVSTRSDIVVPLEFVYDFASPLDGATLCSNWAKALKEKKCANICDHESSNTICPLGFWGLSKVIERHAVTPGLAKDGNTLYLQSEPDRTSDTLYLGSIAILGSSERVPEEDITKLTNLIVNRCGNEVKLAKNWADWEALVKTHRPNLLIALPHTDGTHANITMEIGGKAERTITFKQTHVFPPPVDGRQAPLVALIGCDTAGTADDYGNHMMVFRDRGAGIVIGTIATVFGKHAAEVAGKLVEGMLSSVDARPVRLGELIRDIRCSALSEGLLMPLCLVAYGDADWIISRNKESV